MEEQQNKENQNKYSELNNLLSNKEQISSDFIDKITDKIYLGDIDGASDFDYFSKENITSVLSIINKYPPDYTEKPNINHKLINIDDLDNENIIKYFKECIEFIEKADKIFIHCMCVVSRSATIVIAYLMWKTHCSYYDAYFFVKNRRPFIDPNDGFIKQLKIFEELLKKNDFDLNKIDFNSISIEN